MFKKHLIIRGRYRKCPEKTMPVFFLFFLLNITYQKFLDYASLILKKGTDLVDKNFLTVSEFAKKANVSNQAVYKRLRTDLEEFKKVVEGQLYIDSTCLSKFTVGCQPVDNQPPFIDKPVDNQGRQPTETKQLIDRQNLLDSEIQELTKEINLKNELINRLDNQIIKLEQALSEKEKEYIKLVERQSASLNSKDEDIGLLIDKLTLLFDQQQKLNLQQQTFLSNGNQPEQEKKSLWQRIFNK